MAIITVKCPNCGKSIQTDDRLEKSFCVYCGAAIYPERDIPLGIVDYSEKQPDNTVATQDPVSPAPAQNNSPDNIPITQMTYEQLMEKGKKIQEEALAQAKGIANDMVLPHGILYSEFSDEEKKNPKKLSFGEYLNRELFSEKKFIILFSIALVFLLTGLIVLTAAFHVVAVGIVFAVIMCGGMMIAIILGLSKRRCTKCKTDFAYADIEYEHLRNIAKKDSKGRRLNFHRYRFTIKCPSCGKEKIFEEDVLVEGGHIDLRKVTGRKQDKVMVGKSKWPIVLLCSAFIIVGLIFLIIGAVILGTADKDPKDYYGTYELSSVDKSSYSKLGWDSNLTIDDIKEYYHTESLFKLEIDKKEAKLSGLIVEQANMDRTYSYTYVEAKNLSSNIKSPAYEDKDAILLERDSSTSYVFYVMSNDPYVFEYAGLGMYLGSTDAKSSSNNTQNNMTNSQTSSQTSSQSSQASNQNSQNNTISAQSKNIADYCGHYVVSGIDETISNYYDEDDYALLIGSYTPEEFYTITIYSNSIVLSGEWYYGYDYTYTEYEFIDADDVEDTIYYANNIGLNGLALLEYGSYDLFYYIDVRNGHLVLIDHNGFVLIKQ